MEENNAKIGKVIAIIFAVLIGIAVIFVMVVKDKEGGKSSSSISSKEQVYDKHDLSFTYPAGFVITTDDYEDGMQDVVCEVKGSDVAQIEITCVYKEELSGMRESEKREMCSGTLNSMEDNLRGNYMFRLAKFEPFAKQGYMGKFPCYQRNFSVSVFSEKSEGVIKMAITDDGHMLMTVALYENDSYKNKIEQIENSIKLQ